MSAQSISLRLERLRLIAFYEVQRFTFSLFRAELG